MSPAAVIRTLTRPASMFNSMRTWPRFGGSRRMMRLPPFWADRAWSPLATPAAVRRGSVSASWGASDADEFGRDCASADPDIGFANPADDRPADGSTIEESAAIGDDVDDADDADDVDGRAAVSAAA